MNPIPLNSTSSSIATSGTNAANAASASPIVVAGVSCSPETVLSRDNLGKLLSEICPDMNDDEAWSAFPLEREFIAMELKKAIKDYKFKDVMLLLNSSSSLCNLQKTLSSLRVNDESIKKDTSPLEPNEFNEEYNEFNEEYDDIKINGHSVS